MEEKLIQCKILTPMFSSGAYPKAELRTTELKGMMRYVYRMTCPSEISTLRKDEGELFGGAAGSQGKDTGHASPIRLQFQNLCLDYEKKELLAHEKEKNPKMSCIKSGNFQIVLRKQNAIQSSITVDRKEVAADMDWYVELIKLTFSLCGLGKRSRKARGSVTVCDSGFKNQEDVIEWLCAALNRIAEMSSAPIKDIYCVEENQIVSGFKNSLKRPIIQKIIIGEALENNNIQKIWKAIDENGHLLQQQCKDETVKAKAKTIGIFDSRFASSLWISVIKINGNIFPIYTYLNAVIKGHQIDKDCKLRDEIRDEIEKRKRTV